MLRQWGTAMLRVKSKFITFADGWASCWAVKDRRLDHEKQAVIHFHESTVGERRFWDAQVAGVEIIRAIYVPFGSNVSKGDILLIDGEQYEVAQKDRKDTAPTSWLLSLQKAMVLYGSQK